MGRPKIDHRLWGHGDMARYACNYAQNPPKNYKEWDREKKRRYLETRREKEKELHSAKPRTSLSSSREMYAVLLRDNKILERKLMESNRKLELAQRKDKAYTVSQEMYDELRRKLLKPSPRTRKLLELMNAESLKRMKILAHRFRLPTEAVIRKAKKLGKKTWVLSHIFEQKKKVTRRYNQMYSWGSRVPLGLKVYDKIARIMKDPAAEVTVSEKYNGVHFSALARIVHRGEFELEFLSVQGKNGKWAFTDKWWDVILDKLKGMTFKCAAKFFGEECNDIIVAGELIGRGELDNWRTVTASVQTGRDNLTVVIYDVVKFNSRDEKRYYRFSPSVLCDLLDTWRTDQTDSNLIARPMLITGNDWRIYRKTKQWVTDFEWFVKAEGVVTKRSIPIKSEIIPRLRPLRLIDDQDVAFLLALDGEIQTTDDERTVISALGSKRFPVESESLKIYFMVIRLIKSRTEAGKSLTEAEMQSVKRLTEMKKSYADRLITHSHEVRNAGEKSSFLRVQEAMNLISKTRTYQKEGIVIHAFTEGRHRFHKSKISYARYHKCILLSQEYGILLGYDGSKRIRQATDRRSLVSHIPNTIYIYLTEKLEDCSVHLRVVATVPLKWADFGQDNLDDIFDIEGMICDSAYISSEAAKRFLYLLVWKGDLSNMHFFGDMQLLDEKICQLSAKIGDTNLIIKMKRSKKFIYCLFNIPDYTWASTASQVIEKDGNLFLDGFFVRYLVYDFPIIPPPPLVCEIISKNEKLPVSVKLLVGQPVPLLPEINLNSAVPTRDQEQICSRVIRNHSYRKFSALKMSVDYVKKFSDPEFAKGEGRHDVPVQFVEMATVADVCKLMTAAERRLMQMKKKDAFFETVHSLSQIPKTTFDLTKTWIGEALKQHDIDRAYIWALEGKPCGIDVLPCDSTHTNLGLDFALKKTPSAAYMTVFNHGSAAIQEAYYKEAEDLAKRGLKQGVLLRHSADSVEHRKKKKKPRDTDATASPLAFRDCSEIMLGRYGERNVVPIKLEKRLSRKRHLEKQLIGFDNTRIRPVEGDEIPADGIVKCFLDANVDLKERDLFNVRQAMEDFVELLRPAMDKGHPVTARQAREPSPSLGKREFEEPCSPPPSPPAKRRRFKERPRQS